jgi:hypothetical protein
MFVKYHVCSNQKQNQYWLKLTMLILALQLALLLLLVRQLLQLLLSV